MKAYILGFTKFNDAVIPQLEYQLHDEPVTDADELAEFAGRACYQSWERPNPATATNVGYLENIIKQRHFSVLEHATITLYLEGVARSFTHELVRHRHMSYSQLSQRFVDESEAECILPPGGDFWEDAQISAHQEISNQLYKDLVAHRLARGQTRKQAREAGRAVLPNSTETRIVVTGNMRAWREVIEKRSGEGVDVAFKENAATILVILKHMAPNTFQDFV